MYLVAMYIIRVCHLTLATSFTSNSQVAKYFADMWQFIVKVVWPEFSSVDWSSSQNSFINSESSWGKMWNSDVFDSIYCCNCEPSKRRLVTKIVTFFHSYGFCRIPVTVIDCSWHHLKDFYHCISVVQANVEYYFYIFIWVIKV